LAVNRGAGSRTPIDAPYPSAESGFSDDGRAPLDVATGPGGPEPDAPLSRRGQGDRRPVPGADRLDAAAPGTRWRSAAASSWCSLILVAIIGPHLVQNPDTFQPQAWSTRRSCAPRAAFGGISWPHPLGVEAARTGRDGAGPDRGRRPVLAVDSRFLAAVLAVGHRHLLRRGWPDTSEAGSTRSSPGPWERVPRLPVGWCFALALAGVIPNSGFGPVRETRCGIAVLIFVIGFFNWPYMGRIIRGQNPVAAARARVRRRGPRSLGAARAARTSCSGNCLPNPGGTDSWCNATLLIPTNNLVRGGP